VRPRARHAATPLFALLALLAACGPERSGAGTARLFAEHCASCHGDDGRGLPARRGLEPRLDLARSAMAAKGDRQLLYQRIAFGYSTMPGFAHKLKQGELEQLADYVQRFARTAD
jgi:mono/diheme cytochrome c family protein